jgi:hypothetical protein
MKKVASVYDKANRANERAVRIDGQSGGQEAAMATKM